MDFLPHLGSIIDWLCLMWGIDIVAVGILLQFSSQCKGLKGKAAVLSCIPTATPLSLSLSLSLSLHPSSL